MPATRRESHMTVKPSHDIMRRNWPHAGTPTKGTVRVIHIFAPQVIKTDVANFRSIVQKLTGKTSGSGKKSSKAKLQPQSGSSGQIQPTSQSSEEISSPRSVESSSPRSTNIPISLELTQFMSMSKPSYECPSSQNSFARLTESYPTSFPKSTQNSTSARSNQYRVSCTVDPFQCLSGYKEKLPVSGISHLDTTNIHFPNPTGFSDMDILTGLGSATPLPEFSMPPPLYAGFLPESFLPSSLCRVAVQNPLTVSIPAYNHF